MRHQRGFASPSVRAHIVILLALLTAFVFARLGEAQDSPPSVELDPTIADTPQLDPADQAPEGADHPTDQTFTPVVAPVPFKNTQLGWGLLLLAGAIHRFDADPALKPSTGAVGGFYTENKSWGLMALEVAKLGHDTWRLRGLLSHAEVNYDFYGIGEEAGNTGRSVAINQEMDFFVASGLRRVTRGFYAGAAIMWLNTTATPQDSLPPELPSLSEDFTHTTLLAPGLQAELDTRDDDYWPRHGSFAKLKGWFFTGALGSSRDFQRYSVAWSWYMPLGSKRFVLATNANAQAVAGDAPFYALPSVGAGQWALRGYTQGRYRDLVAITVQAEARYHSAGRFGATVFGGFGQVAPSLSELPQALVLPAGGLGLRYQLTRRYPMHMRLDYAWGRDGGLLYFGVAEAF
jgi:surface antigen Omp85-like protein